MKILLTNDDGYNAKGIELIYELLKDKYEVYIVAPTNHNSGASSAINVTGEFELTKHSENIYSVNSTPVDCVKMALGVLKINPDLVISGVNNGINMGRCVSYSGTAGASLEATYFNYKSMAVSTYRNNFEIVESEFLEVFNYILEYDLLSADYSLNVNFPNSKKSKGIKKTILALEEASNYILKTEANYYKAGPVNLNQDFLEGTDHYETANGYISISKIKEISSLNWRT